MQITIVGAGLVGRRTAALLSDWGNPAVTLVAQKRSLESIPGVTTRTGWVDDMAASTDLVVIATESPHQFGIAHALVRRGITVVSTADDPVTIERLWGLDDLARDRGAALVVGAAYSPGLSSLLAGHLARRFDEVFSISTAQSGTGGPACARQHHRAMSAAAKEVHGGQLRQTRAGSGRELVWFPDPVGAADCYRAGLADPFLLHRAFPQVSRIESRQATTRRDRLTARLPMLRPPHPEGLVGAIWTEVRGMINGRVEHRALAATAPQATGAAAMSAALCSMLESPQEPRGPTANLGVWSVSDCENTHSFLRLVSKVVRLWTYDGSQVLTKSGMDGPVHVARKWRTAGENPASATNLEEPK